MKKNNDWKERLNIVYSTNPDFEYETEQVDETPTPDKREQRLRVRLDRRNRGGKTVTVVDGFAGSDGDLKELGKWLKGRCGTGGAVKDGEILIQGDFKDKVVELLLKEGYTGTKGAGG